MTFAEKLKKYRMSEPEYKKACDLVGHELQGVEWALFSALWSEHCSYKSSKVHLKKFAWNHPRVVSPEGENAGVLDLGSGEQIAFKMESHNHPSFIEPFQGAATGVGGILRDIFTMGARPIMLANALCFGEPKAPRMKQLVAGVVKGIATYGNCVGVPTVTGKTVFHESYNQNILVNAFALGLFQKGDPLCLSKAQGTGNGVYYVGAKTGRDGVHGASMASEAFDGNSAKNRPTVQIGDPFLEKLLIESCLEVMKQKLVVAIQDMGAAGIVSSSFEMSAKGGVGFDLRLDQVPLRDSSVGPEEILLSESQERMLLIAEPRNEKKLKEVFARWGLDCTQIGTVLDTEKINLYWKGELLTSVDPKWLVDQAPRYERPFKSWEFPRLNPSQDLTKFQGDFGSLEETLKKIVTLPSMMNRSWIYQQYDNRVGARTVQGCETSLGVVRLPSGRGLALSLGGVPSLMRWDAAIGGADSVLRPTLKLALKGFQSIGVTDCLNYGSPENETIMSEFVASLDSMNLASRSVDAPVISGNVSFYNETQGRQITSTPFTGVVGIRGHVDHIPGDHVTQKDQRIYLLKNSQINWSGRWGDYQNRTAEGSGKLEVEQLSTSVLQIRKLVTEIPFVATRLVGKFGRVGTVWSLCNPSQHIGCSVQLPMESLLTESLYEVMVVVSPENEQQFLKSFERMKADGEMSWEAEKIGQTILSDLKIQSQGHQWTWSLDELEQLQKNAWRKTFEELS